VVSAETVTIANVQVHQFTVQVHIRTFLADTISVELAK